MMSGQIPTVSMTKCSGWYSRTQTSITTGKTYGAQAFAKASPTLQFPVGAAVFKASWQIVPDGTKPTAASRCWLCSCFGRRTCWRRRDRLHGKTFRSLSRWSASMLSV